MITTSILPNFPTTPPPADYIAPYHHSEMSYKIKSKTAITTFNQNHISIKTMIKIISPKKKMTNL